MNSRPSTTRDILSSLTRVQLVIAACLLIVGGLAAWRCEDPADVLIAIADALAWVAASIGVPVASGALARKIPGRKPDPAADVAPPPEIVPGAEGGLGA